MTEDQNWDLKAKMRLSLLHLTALTKSLNKNSINNNNKKEKEDYLSSPSAGVRSFDFFSPNSKDRTVYHVPFGQNMSYWLEPLLSISLIPAPI